MVDVDEYGSVTKEQAERLLTDYINTMESGHDVNVIYTMPTRSGFHLITYPFNLQKFNDGFWENITAQSNIEVPTVKKNHLTLLYENLDNIQARRARRRE